MKLRGRALTAAAAALVLAGAIAYGQATDRAAASGSAAADPRASAPTWARSGRLHRVLSVLPRLLHEQSARGRRQGWRTDYPGADNNFSVRLGELTKVDVPLDEQYEPNYVVVPLGATRCSSTARCSSWKTSERRTSRRGGPGPARVLPEGRLSVGRRLLGLARVGPVGSSRSAACCRRASFRSSTSRSTHPIMRTLYDVKEGPAGALTSASGTGAAAARRSAAPTARRCISAASRIRADG